MNTDEIMRTACETYYKSDIETFEEWYNKFCGKTKDFNEPCAQNKILREALRLQAKEIFKIKHIIERRIGRCLDACSESKRFGEEDKVFIRQITKRVVREILNNAERKWCESEEDKSIRKGLKDVKAGRTMSVKEAREELYGLGDSDEM